MTQSMTGSHGVALRVVAAGSAFFWVVLFFGVVDLAVPVEGTPGFYESYLLDTGWGVLYTFLVGGAFASLAVRPGMAMPVVQIALVGGCWAATAVAAGSWSQLMPALLLASNCCALLALSRGQRRLSTGWHLARLDPVVGVVAALLIPLGLVFAADLVSGYREGRPPPDYVTWGIDHWPTQAALALAIPMVATAVAAGVCARWSGTAASAACVAVTAGWFGFWSVVYPDHAGSAGAAWGMALIVWACAFTGVVVWRGQRAVDSI